jgi:hypothetical protein
MEEEEGNIMWGNASWRMDLSIKKHAEFAFET